MTYRVIEKNGWSYVVWRGHGELPPPQHSGPWRYKWEAQEYADELNGVVGEEAGDLDANKD